VIVNRHDQSIVRQAFEAAGAPPAMTFLGRHFSCGGSAPADVHFTCGNADEVEAYVRRVVAHAPHVVLSETRRDAGGCRRISLSLDSDCPGLADGPVHRQHLRLGIALARRALDACMEAGRSSTVRDR
jgi:hypothetical protein